ncbi:MAG: glycosyltransferase family 39 protein [Verrucomicrobia bacterium]|nr:glycosyltransferase family 39 protein [Verrucomicrobiota bacterium]
MLCLALALLFAHLGHFPLMKPDELRNAEVGREMFMSGAWLVPTYNGLAYLDKPAFHFKSMALCFSLFGVNEAAARLPSALSGLAILIALFLFARRAYGERHAVLAAAIVVTLPLFVAFSRLVILDMMFTLFVCLAIFAGFVAEEHAGRRRKLWHLAGVVAAALATLIKGPIGLVLSGLVLALFFICDKRPRAILRMAAPLNLIVFVALVLPWFLMLSQRHPDFPYYGLVRETFERFTDGDAFRRRKPFYFYAPLIAGTFFAWSLLLPESILMAWRARTRWTRADRLCLVWACVVVVFFSLPESKQPGYILNVTVPVGLLLARLFVSGMAGRAAPASAAIQRGVTGLAVGSAVLTLALGAICLRPDDATIWLNCSRELLDVILPHLGPMAMAGIFMTGFAIFARQRRSSMLAFVLFAAFFPLLVGAGYRGLETYAGARSERSVAAHVPPLPPGTELVSVQCLSLSLPFYLQRQVTVITEGGREFSSNYIPYGLTLPRPWPTQVVPLRKRDAWLANHAGSMFVVGNRRSRGVIEDLAATHGAAVHDLTRGYVGVLVHRPEVP